MDCSDTESVALKQVLLYPPADLTKNTLKGLFGMSLDMSLAQFIMKEKVLPILNTANIALTKGV